MESRPNTATGPTNLSAPLPPFVQPTVAELVAAADIVESPSVISAYTASEWDELGIDGRVWIAAIVREATRRANAKPAITAETIAHVNAFLTHMADRFRERTSHRVLGIRRHSMSRMQAMSLAVDTFDGTIDLVGTWFGDPSHRWDRDHAHEMVDSELQHWAPTDVGQH